MTVSTDLDRRFRAFDVKTGQTLWQARLGPSVQGFPVSFTAGGKQYIAVTTGLGGGSPRRAAGAQIAAEKPARLCVWTSSGRISSSRPSTALAIAGLCASIACQASLPGHGARDTGKGQ